MASLPSSFLGFLLLLAQAAGAWAQLGGIVYNCKGGSYCPQYTGYKWTCTLRNLNPTLPLNYPALTPTSNFAPSYTESSISPLATFLGYLDKNGCSSSFTFYNNLTTPGFPSFSVPNTDYASVSVTTASNVAGLSVQCDPTKIQYCSEGVQLIAKVSCKFLSIVPNTVYDVQFTTANFNPLYVSGINPDGTLPSDKFFSPFSTYSFSFQQLISPPGVNPITLQLTSAQFFP